MSQVDSEKNLAERLDIITALPISLDDRVFMSLVCLDLIPAWEVGFHGGEEVDAHNVDELNAKLIDAGFETRKREYDWDYGNGPGKKLEICYSNSIELVDRLFRLNQENSLRPDGSDQDQTMAAQYGELYGFPPTAVQAYVDNEENGFGGRDLPPELGDPDYAFITRFKLSSNNWREELETPKKWAAALAQHVPNLWQEFVAQQRRFRAENWGDLPPRM